VKAKEEAVDFLVGRAMEGKTQSENATSAEETHIVNPEMTRFAIEIRIREVMIRRQQCAELRYGLQSGLA